MSLSGDTALPPPTFTAPPVNAPATPLGFTLTVTDDRGGQATDPVTVTVQPSINQPPVVDSGGAQTVRAGVAVTLAGSASDPDGSVVAVQWTQVAGPEVTLADAGTLTARFTAPAVPATTELTFLLTAIDNRGGNASAPVKVTVVPNEPPAVSAGADQVADEGAAVTLSGSASDTDGSVVSVQWLQIGGPGVTLTGANLLSAFFTAPAVSADSALTFQLTATDNEGASRTATTQVTVRNVNQPPVANAGTNQTVDEDSIVTLAGSGTDPDGSVVAYHWAQTTGRTVVLTNANTAVATFKAPQFNSPATLTFELTVTDNQGATGSARVTVRVRNNIPNTLPVGSAGPDQTVDERKAVTLSGTATDADGTITSLQWTQTAGPAVALAGAQSATATFTAPEVTARTELVFALSATDSGGAVVTDVVRVFVRHVPVAPVVDAGPDLAADEGTPVTIQASATGVPVVSYKWTRVSGPSVSLSGATTATVSFTAPQVTADAVLVLKLAAKGDQGATGSDTVNVTVRHVNKPPVAKVNLDKVVNEGAAVSLSGTGSKDPDGTIVSYLWAQTGGPAVVLSDPSSPTPGFTAPQVSAQTVLTFALTVTDDAGATGRASTKVTVRNVR